MRCSPIIGRLGELGSRAAPSRVGQTAVVVPLHILLPPLVRLSKRVVKATVDGLERHGCGRPSPTASSALPTSPDEPATKLT